MARVILADDDPFLIKIYKTRLTQDGHEVVTCSDGETALEESLKQKPDLVVLDIMLPRLNGLEVLSGIRADKKCKDVPVVFLTNLAQEEEQKEALDRGATKFMIKAQFTPSQVITELQEFLPTPRKPEAKTAKAEADPPK